MEKQPELFGELKGAGEKQKFFGTAQPQGRTFTVEFTRERLIIAALCAIVAMAIVFAAGFEKGKKSIMARPAAQAQARAVDTAARPPADRPAVVPAVPEERPYRILVVTYKSREYAQQEAARLRQRGLEPEIVPSGEFHQIYAGAYSTQKEAEQVLATLKKTYKSCYIRKR